MRLFQQQSVYTPSRKTHPVPAPAPPPPPPFVTDEQEERGLCLLKESSGQLREGRLRLPTPDKAAIMELSASFDKRRLGKQQQILTEITQRCREQEVTDLSSKLSAKVSLQKAEDSQDSLPFMATAPPSRRRRSGGRRPSDASLPSSDDLLRENEAIERRLNFEKGYKFFPARRIIRQPCQTSFFQPANPRSGSESYCGRHSGTAPLPATRLGTELDLEPRAHTVDDHNGKVPGTIQNYLQPKLDAVPPLLLADLHGSWEERGQQERGQQERGQQERGQQDRVGYYFSSSRLPLSQRSRTYFDSSRVAGRPFQPFPAGVRAGAGARRGQGKGKEGGRGLHTMIQQILSDMDSSRQRANKRAGVRNTPLHPTNCLPSMAKMDGQKV